MDPFTIERAITFGTRVWMYFRPFSPEKRAARKERKRIRQENRRLKKLGLPVHQEDDTQMAKLLELLAQYAATKRTSTKAGAAGLAPLIVTGLAMLPYYDEINALLVQACTSEQGPLAFLAGGAVVWVIMYVTARKTKSPENPGVL